MIKFLSVVKKMAENFKLPERFTKEWFKYIFDYYRWHIIITVAVIVAVSLFVYGKITAVKPDINLAMAGNIVLQPENEDMFQLKLDKMVKDVNNDGKTKVFRPMYYIYDKSTQTGVDFESAMSQKLSIEFMSQRTYLFVLDKTMAERYSNLPDTAFLKTEKWAGEHLEEELFKDAYGRNYGVSLKDSKILKECGIDGSDMYLFIRILTDHNEENDKKYEESIRFAKELIK